jgi:type III pantothenate kinase
LGTLLSMQESSPNSVPLIALSVGNSRFSLALCHGDEVGSTRFVSIDAPSDVLSELKDLLPTATAPVPVVLSSVNEAATASLLQILQGDDSVVVYKVGVDVPIPLRHSLAEDNTTGVDRFLAALAAYRVMDQACVVVDAGSALTVDFVDGEGTYHGGCILPGAQMMLASLHEQTAALPELSFRLPDDEVYPKTTEQAMLTGVVNALRGAVRQSTERYALDFGAFPSVVATGGDAPLLFGDDELIDRVVPDLVLRGIAMCATEAMAQQQ